MYSPVTLGSVTGHEMYSPVTLGSVPGHESIKQLSSSFFFSFFFFFQMTHHFQYPQGTEQVFSYFECRGGKFPEVVFFGLQYVLKVSCS